MKETFKRNNNPFVITGTMGRLGFFISNTLLFLISTILWAFLCPTGIMTANEPLLAKNYPQLILMWKNAAKPEFVIFLLILLAVAALTFVIVKKRVLDMDCKNPNALRNSYIVAAGTALIPVMGNCVVNVSSLMNAVLFYVSIIITLCLIFVKGYGSKNNEE